MVPAPAPPATDAKPSFVTELFASLVVFMVALPLCIGIAQACGLKPEAGIITGVIGGLVVGVLAGSPLQVSGPAAGLIVLVVQYIDDAKARAPQYEPAVLLGLALVLAGGIQLAAGALSLGRWFRAVTPAVVEGMLAGIGLTILAKQFYELLDDVAPKGISAALAGIPECVRKAFVPTPDSRANHTEAAVIGLVALLILALWKPLAPKKLKLIPAAVVAVLAGVLINEFGRPVFEALGVRLGPAVDDHGGIGVQRVKVSANLMETVRPVFVLGWDALGFAFVWKGALTFALIASAETLLCSVAVDSKHTGPRTQYDRELAAQGAGNVLCGVLGALPMTGVIVRSAANVEAGARTRWSAVMHGAWLLLFVLLLPGVLSRIPETALAAVLVYTGWKLLNLPGLWHLWTENRTEALIFVTTAATIVGADLLAGVVTGLLVSMFVLLVRFSHLSVSRAEPEPGAVTLTLEGAATFIRLPLITGELDALPRGRRVRLNLEAVQLIDHAVMHLLLAFQKQYALTGGTVEIDWGPMHLPVRGDAPGR